MSKPSWDCHCFLPYPNYHRKKKNGKWKCVDDMECIRDYIPNKSWNCATHCIKKNRKDREGGEDMAEYDDLPQKLRERVICKAVIGDYVIYRRDWLHKNIEQEYVLQKSARDFAAIAEKSKKSLKELREYLKGDM